MMESNVPHDHFRHLKEQFTDDCTYPHQHYTQNHIISINLKEQFTDDCAYPHQHYTQSHIISINLKEQSTDDCAYPHQHYTQSHIISINLSQKDAVQFQREQIRVCSELLNTKCIEIVLMKISTKFRNLNPSRSFLCSGLQT